MAAPEPTTKAWDLLIAGGHLIDPGADRDGSFDVALKGGRVARVAPHIAPDTAQKTLDARGLYVAPGLIDLHTHIYWGVSALAVDVASLAPASGVTTWVDAGSAGAITFPGFRRFIAEQAPVNVLAFLNISSQGILDIEVAGEYENIRWCELARAVQTIEVHRDCIVGVKVRASRNGVREAGIEPAQIAREAADAAGMPLMAHIGQPPPALREVLPLLQEGDILTHLYRGPAASILTREGAIRPDVLAARERGAFMDVGHGMGSLDFQVARRALDQGFTPDIISSDLHQLNLEGPVFGLVPTLSKFLALGLTLPQVIAAATWAPAQAIRRAGEIGTLREGARGDVTLLTLEEGDFTFTDSVGQQLHGTRRLAVECTVVEGRPLVPPLEERE